MPVGNCGKAEISQLLGKNFSNHYQPVGKFFSNLFPATWKEFFQPVGKFFSTSWKVFFHQLAQIFPTHIYRTDKTLQTSKDNTINNYSQDYKTNMVSDIRPTLQTNVVCWDKPNTRKAVFIDGCGREYHALSQDRTGNSRRKGQKMYNWDVWGLILGDLLILGLIGVVICVSIELTMQNLQKFEKQIEEKQNAELAKNQAISEKYISK